eukprot:5145117-Pyramimonas_sp.AAC.1
MMRMMRMVMMSSCTVITQQEKAARCLPRHRFGPSLFRRRSRAARPARDLDAPGGPRRGAPGVPRGLGVARA